MEHYPSSGIQRASFIVLCSKCTGLAVKLPSSDAAEKIFKFEPKESYLPAL
jgi:hypothetical protein